MTILKSGPTKLSRYYIDMVGDLEIGFNQMRWEIYRRAMRAIEAGASREDVERKLGLELPPWNMVAAVIANELSPIERYLQGDNVTEIGCLVDRWIERKKREQEKAEAAEIRHQQSIQARRQIEAYLEAHKHEIANHPSIVAMREGIAKRREEKKKRHEERVRKYKEHQQRRKQRGLEGEPGQDIPDNPYVLWNCGE